MLVFRFRFAVKLNIKRLDLLLAHKWTIARTKGTNVSPVIVVELIGADGTVGLGEVAPEKTIRVDANEGWKTKEEALQNIETLAADRHIQYVEQPMPASTSVKDWAWLKQRSPLPIFGDESYHLAKDIPKAAECF